MSTHRITGESRWAALRKRLSAKTTNNPWISSVIYASSRRRIAARVQAQSAAVLKDAFQTTEIAPTAGREAQYRNALGWWEGEGGRPRAILRRSSDEG